MGLLLLLLALWAECLLPSAGAYSRVSLYSQARSGSQNVAFTLSPIHAAGQRTTVELRPGEAVNHPTPKYSTLDEEQLSQLDASAGRKGPQERFHPPASFEHALSHVKAIRQPSPVAAASSSKDVMYSKPLVSMTYDYPPAGFEVKPKPAKDAFPPYAPGILDGYRPKPSSAGKPQETLIYESKPAASYELDEPSKALDYPDHYSPYGQAPYHDEEVIYEQVPEDHRYPHYHHPKPKTTTMEPEPMDQRLNKRPYSYYYIGKKLWYVPLYFSIYFIIYIAALVLKSVARHKINFPAHLAAVAASNEGRNGEARQAPGWMDYVARALEAIESYGNGYGRQ